MAFCFSPLLHAYGYQVVLHFPSQRSHIVLGLPLCFHLKQQTPMDDGYMHRMILCEVQHIVECMVTIHNRAMMFLAMASTSSCKMCGMLSTISFRHHIPMLLLPLGTTSPCH
eukprot:c26397_g1_i1 orf=312-647(+)